ncbi:bacitracin ABC transporter ATP-binding protein [Leptospira perolatii]|uniref:Bacitracin ABC transporter ATP-binding protein n=1 Tax=Leptospira perolatii TaxID=2023191 RepID=A0A2M9ZJJ4_9LEPT|nr:ABC transporter ATP-binding protein [Leptospira perolatii]PJZ68424.1 bacitracin ABC transporter ATP-binding protein [Leptospira perolatii]PJZ72123.1 bacitracin ABC transporter ATP-binding protein [Leptospira perolatii]
MTQEVNKNFVQISNVHQVFGQGKSRYYALADVNLNIAQGEFISIIGHSGCGKSTLLNIVAGLTTPTSGKVKVDGLTITKPSLERAVVFQSHSLLPWLTVEENVRIAIDSVYPDKDKHFRKQEALKYVEMVHLLDHAKKKPSEISGGMKQRVGIARAFATNPKVLLLDEPFGALDALTRGSMQDELNSIWEKNRKTVLMITHDVDEAMYLSDRIILMSNGPKANIAKILDIPIPRPRDRDSMIDHPMYDQIRKEMLHYLIHTGAHVSVA